MTQGQLTRNVPCSASSDRMVGSRLILNKFHNTGRFLTGRHDQVQTYRRQRAVCDPDMPFPLPVPVISDCATEMIRRFSN